MKALTIPTKKAQYSTVGSFTIRQFGIIKQFVESGSPAEKMSLKTIKSVS